jgi:AAA15 family ATPase/GTPase
MIRRLEVKGLNDQVDSNHDLFFHEDLNIFTGANGSGKTTLLKLIWYLISGNLDRIFPEIPFKSVVIETDLFSLNINRVAPNMVKLDGQISGEKVSEIVNIEEEKGLDGFKAQISRAMKSSLFFPTFRRIEGGFSSVSEYLDVNSWRYLSSQIARNHQYMRGEMVEVQEAISSFSTTVSVSDHKFIASISTHDIVRLLEQKHSEISGEVNKRHQNSSDEITQKIRDYFSKGTETDTQDLQEAKTVLDDIQKRLEKVDKEQEALFQPISVLSEYVSDFFKDYGIRITENITLGHDTETISNAISSDKLSAGEKQMLSFLCYNAFSEETVVFIDEPELSLHVDWQRLLFPTLLKQGQKNQFFVATHSPFIYSKYPDKEFMLDDYRGGV